MPQCVFLQYHLAERCLIDLIIEDLFQDAFDANACSLATKHSSDALEILIVALLLMVVCAVLMLGNNGREECFSCADWQGLSKIYF